MVGQLGRCVPQCIIIIIIIIIGCRASACCQEMIRVLL
jgi:hypothetical protein